MFICSIWCVCEFVLVFASEHMSWTCLHVVVKQENYSTQQPDEGAKRKDKGSMQLYYMYQLSGQSVYVTQKSEISTVCWCCMKSQRFSEVILYIWVNLMTLLLFGYKKSILQQHKGVWDWYFLSWQAKQSINKQSKQQTYFFSFCVLCSQNIKASKSLNTKVGMCIF